MVERDDSAAAPPVVLVVDDDASIRRLCRGILEKQGWCVVEAEGGDEAVAVSHQRRPDVILLDLLMPQMGGLEVTRQLRHDPETEAIPVIMLSAKSDAADIQAAFDAGADEFIAKPIVRGEIVSRVRSMIRLGRLSAELQRSVAILGQQTLALTQTLDYVVALARTEELSSILDLTVQTASTLVAARSVAIMLPEPVRPVLRIHCSAGIDEAIAAKIAVPIGGPISGEVFATGRQVVLNSFQQAANRRDVLYDSEFFTGVPLASLPLCASERTVGVLNITQRVERKPFTDQEIEYLSFVCHHAASAIQVVLTREARDEARDSVVIALARLAEHRDKETGRHLDRMTLFCLELARELHADMRFVDQIDASFLANLQRAAPLHDIGKVAVPDSILLKPGKLTPDEIALMRTHVAAGADTLRSVLAKSPDSGFLKMAVDIAQGHHEWFDGSGYPDNVSGDAIPLSARIAALADVYDALTTKRVYKQAYPHAAAIAMIASLSGTQFDPRIVQAFLRCESRFERLARELADEPRARSAQIKPTHLSQATPGLIQPAGLGSTASRLLL